MLRGLKRILKSWRANVLNYLIIEYNGTRINDGGTFRDHWDRIIYDHVWTRTETECC